MFSAVKPIIPTHSIDLNIDIRPAQVRKTQLSFLTIKNEPLIIGIGIKSVSNFSRQHGRHKKTPLGGALRLSS